ncbi:hypothetical protein ACFT9I_30430 [Streptomyces sp. NPDC057137]|uniref:hypothetical protein n=1 Tax=Streptomyces sp. NPDC057137 TaxID=3346030 RepID=UPI00363001E3
MSLSIHVRNPRHHEIDSFADDPEDSFREMCQRAPDDSLRRGVMQFADTMFNTVQLHRFVDELESLPASEMTSSIQKALDCAKLAIRKSGYLYFVGD